MAELKKVVAIKDDSSHWYVIPAEKKDLFTQLQERCIQNDDEWELFETEFSQYMTGGDLNLTQLYAEI